MPACAPTAVRRPRIGSAAAALVEPGDTILLDSGTTVLEVARHLPESLLNDRGLTVVTRSLCHRGGVPLAHARPAVRAGRHVSPRVRHLRRRAGRAGAAQPACRHALHGHGRRQRRPRTDDRQRRSKPRSTAPWSGVADRVWSWLTPARSAWTSFRRPCRSRASTPSSPTRPRPGIYRNAPRPWHGGRCRQLHARRGAYDVLDRARRINRMMRLDLPRPN